MELKQFDIDIAFLKGDLLEVLYMSQPEGFIDTNHPDFVYLLHKSLYGLRQSTCQWNKKMDYFLKQSELISSDAHSCIYHNK